MKSIFKITLAVQYCKLKISLGGFDLLKYIFAPASRIQQPLYVCGFQSCVCPGSVRVKVGGAGGGESLPPAPSVPPVPYPDQPVPYAVLLAPCLDHPVP